MTNKLNRLLAIRFGNSYENAESRHHFRDTLNASAEISTTKRGNRGVSRHAAILAAPEPMKMGAGFSVE